MTNDFLNWLAEAVSSSTKSKRIVGAGDNYYDLVTRELGTDPLGDPATLVEWLEKRDSPPPKILPGWISGKPLNAPRDLGEVLEEFKKKAVYFQPDSEPTKIKLQALMEKEAAASSGVFRGAFVKHGADFEKASQAARSARLRRFSSVLGREVTQMGGSGFFRAAPLLALAMLLGGGLYGLSRDSSTT